MKNLYHKNKIPIIQSFLSVSSFFVTDNFSISFVTSPAAVSSVFLPSGFSSSETFSNLTFLLYSLALTSDLVTIPLPSSNFSLKTLASENKIYALLKL